MQPLSKDPTQRRLMYMYDDLVAGAVRGVDGVEDLHEDYAVLGRGDAGRLAKQAVDVVVDLLVEEPVEAERGAVGEVDVGHVAVEVRVEVQFGVHLRAGLVAE